jgi:hypothetical protein
MVPSLRAIVWPNSLWPFGTLGSENRLVLILLVVLIIIWNLTVACFLIRGLDPVYTSLALAHRWVAFGVLYAIVHTIGLFLIRRTDLSLPVGLVQNGLAIVYLGICFLVVFRVFPVRQHQSDKAC